MVSRKRILVVTPILWLGFVLSISFMEAWLKFQAEGVTQQVALSIGKLIFSVLNKVEFFFFLVITIVAFNLKPHIPKKPKRRIILALGVILLLQTFHLLPILDQRADLIITGIAPSKSYFHFYYVALEIVKVILLMVLVNKSLAVLLPSEILKHQKSDAKLHPWLKKKNQCL